MKKLTIIIAFAVLSISLLQSNTSFSAATTESHGPLSLGSLAPDFKLPDVTTGKMISRDDYAGKKVLLVIFMCRHCPFVQHDKEGILQLAKDYSDKNVGIVAVSSNDPAAYAADAPESLKEMAIQDNFLMPLLFDETQETAKAYNAMATPEFFLFNKDRKLVYHGQFDDARPGNDIPVTGKDVRKAIDDTLQDKPVSFHQKRAIGCSIKWKPGNELSL